MGNPRNKDNSYSRFVEANKRRPGTKRQESRTSDYHKVNNTKKEKASGFQRESDFKKHIIARLKKIKGLYYFVKEAAAIRGIPDIIICYKGQYVAWELKKSIWELYYKTKKGMKLTGRTTLQYHTIQKVRKAGGKAYFVYPENLDEKMQELLKS